MPVLICLRKELWTGLISVGDQVATCPVFTRAKIKSRLGILINFPVTNGFNEVFKMWSWLGFSKMSSQKRKAVIAWRASVEAERALGFWPVDDVDAVCGSGESRVTDCDRVKIFGVVIGESEGVVGFQLGLLGWFFVFVGGEELFELVAHLWLVTLLFSFSPPP